MITGLNVPVNVEHIGTNVRRILGPAINFLLRITLQMNRCCMDMMGGEYTTACKSLEGVMKVKGLDVILSLACLAIMILNLLRAVRYYNRGDLSNFWVDIGFAIGIGAVGVLYLVERQDLRTVITIVAIVGIVISAIALLLET